MVVSILLHDITHLFWHPVSYIRCGYSFHCTWSYACYCMTAHAEILVCVAVCVAVSVAGSVAVCLGIFFFCGWQKRHVSLLPLHVVHPIIVSIPLHQILFILPHHNVSLFRHPISYIQCSCAFYRMISHLSSATLCYTSNNSTYFTALNPVHSTAS